MQRIQVMLVVGARPQFIKSAPVIREMLSSHRQIDLSIIHSGQHYDREMSEIFFRELEIPRPLVNLHAGSGSHAAQTATIMKRLEPFMLREEPDVVAVPGDTNTTLAAALSAAKLGIPVAHIEAGLRSGDILMPEEINRKLTDHCSPLLFAPTKTAIRNLKREGLGKSAYLTGDTMVDALHIVMPAVLEREKTVLSRYGVQTHGYVLVTLHRPSNVDDSNRLREIQLALQKVAKNSRVVFPVHPRTRERLVKMRALENLTGTGVIVTKPLSYVETLSLLRNSSCLVTDSGGMQKESFLLQVPCITVRSTTEWPETLEGGANRLVANPQIIPTPVSDIMAHKAFRERIRPSKHPFGDGYASEKIVRIIRKTFKGSA
jgi:UDP-N-acetylglucosamine 2-epimerase